jgi:hypothetical protein
MLPSHLCDVHVIASTCPGNEDALLRIQVECLMASRLCERCNRKTQVLSSGKLHIAIYEGAVTFWKGIYLFRIYITTRTMCEVIKSVKEGVRYHSTAEPGVGSVDRRKCTNCVNE